MNLAELTQLAYDHGFPDPALAAAVAMAESGGDPHAQGDPRGPFDATPNGTSTSFGLWQVHTPAHPEYDPRSLLDPDYNADAAFKISSGGTVWKWWSTYAPENDPATGQPWYLKYYKPDANQALAGAMTTIRNASSSQPSRPSASTTRTARATSAAWNVRFLASTTISAAACGASPS